MSPKRDAKLHSIQVKNNFSSSNKDSEFVDGLHTQWTVRAECLDGVIRNFDEFQKLWDWSLENCSCLEMKACIRGIKVYTLKIFYCFGIHLAHLILSNTNNLRVKHYRVFR